MSTLGNGRDVLSPGHKVQINPRTPEMSHVRFLENIVLKYKATLPNPSFQVKGKRENCATLHADKYISVSKIPPSELEQNANNILLQFTADIMNQSYL